MTDTAPCPVCTGTGRVPCPEAQRQYNLAGYDPATDTLACDNCGGQTMSCHGTGRVLVRPDGTPCRHEYTGSQAGRCYWQYTCRHCGDRYSIDSGD
jgi:hypothetical protein